VKLVTLPITEVLVLVRDMADIVAVPELELVALLVRIAVDDPSTTGAPVLDDVALDVNVAGGTIPLETPLISTLSTLIALSGVPKAVSPTSRQQKLALLSWATDKTPELWRVRHVLAINAVVAVPTLA
jgi:hypothetical protein